MSDRTTIKIDPDVRDELQALKPYPSMSYNDLLRDMADGYDPGGEANA